MKIKTVAVLGAGAVGSYVIWGLSRRKDIRLGVLAEGKRAEKLISDEIGASHVIYSVIKVASHKEENGYCFNPETTIGIISESLAHPMTVNVCRPLRLFLQIQDCIIALQNISGKKCGANSG